MTEIGLGHYFTFSAIIFSIGVIGIFLNRKNIIVILIIYEKKKGFRIIVANELTRLINKEEPYVFDLRSSSEFDAGSIS